MTEREALKLALSTLDEVRSETFRLLRNGQKLYAENKVWDTIFAIKEVLAQPEQERVAWMHPTTNDVFSTYGFAKQGCGFGQEPVPLYPFPPHRKPLTDEQILSVARDHYNPHQRPEISFARAIEAAHGIKEKNT